MPKPPSPAINGLPSDSSSTSVHDNNLNFHPMPTTSTHPGQPAVSFAFPSDSSSTSVHDNNLNFHPMPTTSTHPGQPAVSFAFPSPAMAHPLPRKSPKRRPPTPGGPSFNSALQDAMTPGVPHSHSELSGLSTTTSSVTRSSSLRSASTSHAEQAKTEEVSSLPSLDAGSVQRSETSRPHRRVPSRLNLSSISNHGRSSSSPDDTKPRSSPPPLSAEPTHPLPSGAPVSKSRTRQESSSTSQSDHQAGSSRAAGTSPPVRQRRRRGTGDSEDGPDCQSATTSTNLDSPSTKAMMERLLSAPDYFSLHDSRFLDDDDDDSSGSLKFARGYEDEEENEVRPLRSVREQRERSKIRKLLGDDVGDNRDEFSRPQHVERFSSDGEFDLKKVGRQQGLTGLDIPVIPAGERKQTAPSSFKTREPSSPIAHAHWSSSLPSLNDHGLAEQQSHSSQDRLLLPRVSQDSRQLSASRNAYLGSPPASPRDHQFSPNPNRHHNRHPIVHALDALHPQIATVKRSKTTSSAVRASDLSSPDFFPPPRVSSRNALRPQKDTAARSYVGTEAGIGARPRVRTSKSAKSLSISKSEPHHSPSPAGFIAEEYKRQILDTQNAASPLTKESKRLSALQWMIEQTKSVTRSKSASASVPPSPLSPSQSISPPFSSGNFTRPYAPNLTATGASSATTDHHLSPAGEHGLPVPSIPSPMSAVSANNSSTSLLSPEARFGRPAPMYALNRGAQRSRGDPPLSPVLSSAYPQPPDSPWDGSSSLLVPGSPRSEGHHSSETGHYVPARSNSEYWSSGETKTKEKEKRGLVHGLGKKLSKKRLRKRKGDAEEVGGQDGRSKNRERGRSGTRDEGTQSDVPVPPLPRRGVSVDRPHTIRHRKSLRLSIDKFADDGDGSHPPPSFHGVRSPVHRSISSPGDSLPEAESTTNTETTKKERGGKHFWRLVKRIGSSGGLRDKYQSSPYSPMPALPLPSLETVLTPLRAEVDGNQGLSRGRRSSVDQLTSLTPSKFSSPAKTPASTTGLKHASSSADGHNSYYSHSKAHLQNINSRSSAPSSSDQSPSPRVFQRAHSSRSSISSSAELGVAPPLPTHPPSAYLAQRFGSRSDHGHQSDESSIRPSPGRAPSQRTRRSSNKSAKTATEEDWMSPETAVPITPPSLPTPPRRPKPAITTSLEDVRLKVEDTNDFDSGSPLIPVFTVDNAINQFKRRKPSNAGLGPPLSSDFTSNTPSSNQLEAFPVIRSPSSLSRSSSMPPPPRPARDARRPTPPRTSSGPQQDSSSSVESSSAPRGKLKKVKRDKHMSELPKTSAAGRSPDLGKSNDSTPSLPDLPSQHIISGSSSPLVTSPSSSNPRSPANDFVAAGFRERPSLQLARGLSEREKAEKWDALLEKSEQAGGTLHLSLGLAPGHLDSDRLTLNSMISVDDP